jgi:putative phosphoribosyl transferase
MFFQDRREAGRIVAGRLSEYANRPDVVVLALPRGGVPVAYEVTSALNVPLDVFLVRKIGVPGHEEFAMGAVASDGGRVLNREVIDALQIPDDVVERLIAREERELERRERAYRGDRPFPDLRGKSVILVDDGLATGSTMRAAISALRQRQPARLVVAVPVGSPETCDALRAHVDDIICSIMPDPLYAVGLWYADFSQTTDDEVRELLKEASQHAAARSSS